MIKYVQKRDNVKTKNRVVKFDQRKITVALTEAFKDVEKKYKNGEITTIEGEKVIPQISIDEISLQVKEILNKLEKEIVSVEEIQDIVEKVLIKNNYPEVAKSYILYRVERTKARDLNSRLMKEIYEITFSEAEDANIKRENANIDGNTAMGTMLQYGSAISKAFAKMFVVNPKHSYAHDSGSVHIHDLDFLTTGTLTCCQIRLNKLFDKGFSTGHGGLRAPQSIGTYASLTATVIQSNQNDQHGGQSIPCFDYDLAPGVLKSYKKRFKQNLTKYIKVKFELCNQLATDKCNEIMKQYGEIKSIEFSKEDRKRLSSICQTVLFGNIKSIDGSGEKITCNRLVGTVLSDTLTETNHETYQAMEGLIGECNTMHSRAGAQVPFSSLNFGTDTSPEGRMVTKNLLLAQEAGLGNGETPIFPILIFKTKRGVNLSNEDINYDLFKLACKVSAKRLFPTFSFIDAPFNLQYYIPGRPETEIAYMGCRTRVIGNVCGEEVVDGRGNISFTTINLPRIGIKHGIVTGKRTHADMKGFYKELDKHVNLVIEQLLERLELQGKKKVKNFPFLMGEGVWAGSDKLKSNDKLNEVINQGSLTVGFIGLAETLTALTGQHHGESNEAQLLGLDIIRYMRDKMDKATQKYKLNFALIATPAEGLSGRFVNIDKKIYGVIKGVTDKEYYTNSFHVPVAYNISAMKKIEIEAPYHELTNGGHISYIELDGDVSKNLEAYEAIIRKMATSGIGYGAINHPVDRDPVCGYTGIIGDTCPNCGRDEDSGIFERIRRITGYLVGTVDRFNNAKASEERDRVKHGIKHGIK